MFHNLYFRLLAAFTFIILFIVGSAFFFAYRTTFREMQRVEVQMQNIQNIRVESELGRVFRVARTWDGVQPFIEQMGNLYGRRIIITDVDNIVRADSSDTIIGETYEGDGYSRTLTGIYSSPGVPGIGEIGTLYILPGDVLDVNRAALEIAYNSIGKYFLWGGLLAVLIALLLTGVISRFVLAPVRALTAAAKKFGKGDFSQRVDYQGKGEMRELAQSFNTMADNLERTERLRKNMVADIAHELRTPLTNLRGYLEAVSDGIVEPDEKTIRSLTEETTSLSRLVEDLQELTLADAGALKLVWQSTSITSLVAEAVAGLQAKATAKNISLTTKYDEDIPDIFVDPHRIRQVVLNLVNNALAHTPPEGSVTVSLGTGGGNVELIVADTGNGIPADDLPHIFDRFYRVDKSRTRATGGSGLGLTIARRLVETHGGNISVSSTPGEGSVFTVTIPIKPPQDIDMQ